MVIRYWTDFSKKINSTKHPNNAEFSSLNARLKEPTSMENPTFIFAKVPRSVNYIYVPEWQSYYFVDDITVLSSELIEVSCSEDRLATFKESILSYTGFIEYASGSARLDITDPRNVASESIIKSATTHDIFGEILLPYAGFFLLGVINDQASCGGGITYYALNASQFQAIKADLMTTAIWDQIVKQFFGVDACLQSCTYIPLSMAALQDDDHIDWQVTPVHIGNVVLVDGGYKLLSRSMHITSDTISLTFPARSTYGYGFTYLDKSPYSTGVLYLPFVGSVALDLDYIANEGQIVIGLDVDLITGDVMYSVKVDGCIVSTYSGNLATKIPLSSASYDAVGTASGILNVIGGIAAGNPAMITNASMNLIRSAEIHSMAIGSISSPISAIAGSSATIEIITKVPSEIDLDAFAAEQGMPYYKTGTLSNFSGYVKLQNASVNIPGFSDEKAAVNEMLNTGIFIE